MVVTVSHDDVAVPIHCDSAGAGELSNDLLSVSMAVLASARQNGHIVLQCDLAE
jgi:hypothetical protein